MTDPNGRVFRVINSSAYNIWLHLLAPSAGAGQGVPASRYRKSRASLQTAAQCCCLALACVLPAQGAAGPLEVLLDLRAPASHLVRVTLSVREAAPRTELQFPAWNNLYQIRDFVKDVQELRAQCDGQPAELERRDLNTWRSPSTPCANLELRYAVYTQGETPFSNAFDVDHAFLNFAMLVFYLPHERQRAVRVRFLLPEGWKVACLLEGDGPEFDASNYDVLVDSPVEAGRFQEYSYTQEIPVSIAASGGAARGVATYRVIVHADPADYSPNRLLASLRRITAAETGLMRDVPFTRYTFILHFPREGGGGGGMEHRNGTAITLSAGAVRDRSEAFEAVAAHEFFHLWNVKRIRPDALEPIDYVHGNDTRDLWFSEGVTSTYGELSLLRAGLIKPSVFYARLAGEIQTLQGRPARSFQSAELSGREAWLEKYPDYHRPGRSVSYYNKGELLGFLLDLAIRHASRNQASLDDVMRSLNENFARQGRTYMLADLHAVVSRLAPSYAEAEAFFRECVQGTRELDYDSALGYAGLRLIKEMRQLPSLGFVPVSSFEGPIRVEAVEPDSNAEKAGVRAGDILLKMNGKPISGLPEFLLAWRKPGQKVRFKLRRRAGNAEVEYALGAKEELTYRVDELPHATPEQLRVREGWLRGTTSEFRATP
jgi:predicted metalloprotease with PDZ domain